MTGTSSRATVAASCECSGPPGTASGKRFRVRGQGIEKEGTKGDLIVQVEVAVPEKLTPEQEEAMKAFAEAGGMKY